MGSLDDYIAFQLRRAQDISLQAFARRVGDARLKPGHYAILSVINENPGLNQTLLSQATCRDKSTLTPTLKGLEAHGLVLRIRSETDRRAYCLTLTPEGRAYLKKLTVHARAHGRLLDEIVGPSDKPLLIALLDRISAALGAAMANDADGKNTARLRR